MQGLSLLAHGLSLLARARGERFDDVEPFDGVVPSYEGELRHRAGDTSSLANDVCEVPGVPGARAGVGVLALGDLHAALTGLKSPLLEKPFGTKQVLALMHEAMHREPLGLV